MTRVLQRSARSRQQLERASREWRSALIDVSGTNRLLFFKQTAATLNLDGVPGPAMAELLAGGMVRLARLFPDPDRHLAAKRACKALAAKQREATEEYGVSVAFLALGLATWNRDLDDAIAHEEALADDDGQVAEGSNHARRRAGRGQIPPSAPVLLRSLDLAGRPGSDNWELRLTCEAQLNPVLAHVLAFKGVRLDEQETLEAGDDYRGDLAPIYDHVRKACADMSGFRIDERRLFGAFSYLKQPMVADCADIEALLTSDLVAALAGDEDAIAAIRTQIGEVTEADPDYKPVEAEHLVVNADASQSYVVNAALAGRNLVVQGPPGTGKSQTIANVIACLAAEGKRVLFVAQKRAAITAVLDRLDSVGLGDLTLDLFAASESRRFVADRLREVLDRQAEVGNPVTGALHRSLTASRDRLVGHRNALHTRKQAWGATVADLLAASYGLPKDVTALRLPAATLARWGPHDLDVHAEALGELASKGGLRAGRLTAPGWSTTALSTNAAVAAANQALIAVRADLLPTAAAALGELARDLGVAEPATPADAQQLLRTATDAGEVLDAIRGALDVSLDENGLERLLAATDKQYRKAHGPKLGWGERRQARKEARRLHAAKAAGGANETHRLLLRAKAVRGAWVALGARGAARTSHALPAAAETFAALGAGLGVLANSLQNLELNAFALPHLPSVLGRLADDQSRALLPRVHDLEAQLTAAGVGPLLATLRRDAGTARDTVGTDAVKASTVLRYAAIHSALEQALTTDPALAGVSGEDLDQAATEFRDRDLEHLDANAARVRRAVAVRLIQVLDIHEEQHLALKRELTRKRNYTAVRRLFDGASDVMTAIKPCWAMSPLQVSRLLPAIPCFDVVIFDEASQVKPADAIPALLRAPQAIVAGDSRQLPPTEFFTKVLEDHAEPDAIVTRRSEQEALAAEAAAEDAALDATGRISEPPRPAAETYTRDAESVLFAFDRILAGQSRRLLWHYRSRDERLIATSNAFVYDWSLTTFPAADGHGCLRHQVVSPSTGIKGGTNSPDNEVRRVVDLVVDHARNHPAETLGVITFGVPHSRRIEAALEIAFAANPDIEAILDADEREPFFVKNIERVQGDERDSIILSVGYGKSTDGQLRLFWGPLLKPGGERRLNVAISRARTRMTLVTSFAADDVRDDAHDSDGYQLMQRFVQFVATGELRGGRRRDVVLNPFEIDVRDRLTATGMDLVPQVGVGSYRLDFAVRHPEHPGRYVMAVEVDGANYNSGHVARERDRLRQRLLESRGWTFHRIWSTDWFNDCDREVTAAVAAYKAALAADADLDDGEDLPKETAATWHIAEAQRTTARPRMPQGLTIDKYPPADLVRLVRHVRSDGVLRTRDDELIVLMRELGFGKRGERIVAALTAAQDEAG